MQCLGIAEHLKCTIGVNFLS